MVLYGYGRVLEIDLSTGKLASRGIDPQFAREYIGGMGFGCKFLYDEVGRDVDPLSPDNALIFANGPLTGTRAPCSGRTEITTKSPLTGSIGTGNTGGVWGATLKHAGFDLVVVRKKAGWRGRDTPPL
jgi:aldehyde:ferredoxin oxidoreductase